MSHRLRASAFTISAMVLLQSLAGCGLSSLKSPLSRAESLRAAGKYREAIAEYEAHMKNRIAQGSSDDAPSPYFFAILIGDLHLQLDEPEEARAAYLLAKEHEVSHPLVAHKLRYLGHWYEDHGRNDDAMKVYTEYHDLDPQLFEMDQDRLFKATLDPEAPAKKTPP